MLYPVAVKMAGLLELKYFVKFHMQSVSTIFTVFGVMHTLLLNYSKITFSNHANAVLSQLWRFRLGVFSPSSRPRSIVLCRHCISMYNIFNRIYVLYQLLSQLFTIIMYCYFALIAVMVTYIQFPPNSQ